MNYRFINITSEILQKLFKYLPIALVLLFIGCHESPHCGPSPVSNSAEHVLVYIDGKPAITSAFFEQEMAKRGGHVAGRFSSLQSKQDLLEEMIKFELLARKGEMEGLGSLPEVEYARKSKIVEKYLQQLDKTLAVSPEVPEEEISQYYRAHLSEYQKPAMRQASAIVIKKSGDKKQLEKSRANAEAILAELRQDPGASKFRELVLRDSEDEASRLKNGDLGWMIEGDASSGLDEKVRSVVWSLQSGQISDLIETGDAYYIIRLNEIKTFRAQSYDQVKSKIKYDLINAKVQQSHLAHINSLREEMKIKVDKKLLESVQASGDKKEQDGGPPRFPVGK